LKKIVLNLLLTVLLASCNTVGNRESEKDRTLVIPGQSCEGFALGKKTGISGFTSIVDPTKKDTPLSGILSRHLPRLNFNRIAYMRNRYVLFLHDETVKAVAGLSSINRITDEAVRLSEGADIFIMNYGNSGLEIIRDDRHRIYLYRKLGIALFDDYGDDTIDMYLVFTPEE